MTDHEFDRLAGAWLDLMPREVPDRVIADVLQAVDATPQVRRPRVPALWRPSHMNRFKYAAAAVAVAIIGVVGLSLAGGKPAPTIGASAPPSAAPSAAAVVPPPPSSPPLAAGVTAVADNDVLVAGKRYADAAFAPAFTFLGQDAWLVTTADPTVFQVFVDTAKRADKPQATGKQEDGLFIVMRVGQVLEPGGVMGGPAASMPSDLVAWLEARPDLDLQAPTTIKVSGIDGTLLQGSVRPGAVAPLDGRLEIACAADVAACAAETVPTAVKRSLVTLFADPGSGFEIVVLKVQGQQLLIAMTSDEWTTRRPQLEGFLAGITFTAPAGG
jgi:hypothetical protein